MDETIHDRIRILVEQKAGGKNTEFADRLGVSEANIRGYIKGVVPKTDVLTKIVTSYDIDARWLLTGQGSMDADDPANFVRPGKPIGEFSSLVETIREQAVEIGMLREKVRQLERRLQKDASDALTSGIANVG